MSEITVSTLVHAPVVTVWGYWTNPEHIMEWNHASDDWHCPVATNDLQVGGKFSATMSANDGSASFDFEGTYTDIVEHKVIEYSMADGRKVSVLFEETNDGVKIIETFDAETENSLEMQKSGWQAILGNFRDYVESSI